MTLPEKEKLIDAMIKENSDCTIADYLSLMADIENIENSTDMAFPGIGQEKKDEILKLASTMTAYQIRNEMNVAFSTIYRVLKNNGIDVKEDSKKRRLAEHAQEEERERLEREVIIASRQPKKPIMPDEPFKRPAAIYSNRSPFGIATDYNNQKAAS